MIVITGDSHVNALRRGAQDLEESLKAAIRRPLRIGALGNGKHTLKPFSSISAKRVSFTEPSYAESFLSLTGSDSFDTSRDVTYGLCLGFHSPPVFRHSMWRRSGLSGSNDRHTTPISSSVFEAIVLANNQHIYDLFRQLQSSGVDFFVIASPPPRHDHYSIGETPAERVIEVDRAFRESVQRQLDSMGIRYETPPIETYDGQGFLRDDLANKAPNDFHHGNADYGRLFMRSLFVDAGPFSPP